MAEGERPRGDRRPVADGEAMPGRSPRVATQPGVGPAPTKLADGSDPLGNADTLGVQPGKPDDKPATDKLGAMDTIGVQPAKPTAEPSAEKLGSMDTIGVQPAKPTAEKLGSMDTIGVQPAKPSADKLGSMDTIGVQPAKPGSADTLPAGAKVEPGKAAAGARAKRMTAGVEETLPGPGAPVAALGATVDDRVDGTQAGNADTVGAAAGGGTLQGPYKVADLPTLPRVDDNTYAIGTEIARGGMGKILAARDRRLRREVVIKVMRRDYGRIDPRFEREALITARLQHPSIVRVYDAGVLGDGRAFYAMERVRGRSLEVILGESTTLASRLALLPHAIAVCDALAYAHNEGIVHRDLKPSNVLIGPFGETVVIDWGLAKDLRATDLDNEKSASMTAEERARAAEDSSLTQHGAVMGTPAYMAPEQARGELADERTDVYALGALLYTLLSGAPPVAGASADEVIDAVATGKRRRLDEVVPELPRELASIVERAMEHERAERYRDAKQLADDLRSFAAGKLVPAHEYTTWELVRRWVRRNRVPVAITAGALVLLAGFGVWSFQNIRAERDEASLQKANALVAANNFAEANRELIRANDTFCLEQATRIEPENPSLAAAWLKGLSDEALGSDPVLALAQKLPEAGLAHQLAGHEQDVELIAAGPDVTHVASGSDDATVRWWDLTTNTFRAFAGHKGPIDSMTISSDGKYLATGGTDHKVILWTIATGGKRELDPNAHSNTVRGVAFSPDNTKLASSSEDNTLFVWDVATGAGRMVLKSRYALRPVAWVDNDTLLTGAFDGSLARIELTTGKTTWTHPLKAELRTIAVTPDKAYYVLGDEDGEVAICPATGSCVIPTTKHDDVARKALITPDGHHVVTCGNDHEVHVTSIPDGEVVLLKGNTAGIKDIDVSPDGLVVGAGIDGTVRVWRLDGTLLHTWRGHSAAVKGVAFVGRRVVSGAEDHMVRVWSLDAPPPPPRGPALRAWLEKVTNITTPTPTPKRRGQ